MPAVPTPVSAARRRRLLIHIGTPKTGSTALQKFLARNRGRLAQAGVLYPIDPARPTKRHRQLIDMFQSPRGAPRRAPAEALASLALSEAAAAGADTVVLSHESLSQLSPDLRAPERLSDLFAAHGFAVEFVAFVRDQPFYLHSVYAQQLRWFATGLPFREYAGERTGYRRYDFERLFAPWEQAAGARLILIPYAAVGGSGDSITDFLAATGLTERWRATTGPGAAVRANEVVGPLLTEACRRLYLDGYRPRTREAVAAASAVLRRHANALDWNEQRFQALTPDLAQAIGERYAASNDRLARRHWGADWTGIFGRADRDLPPANEIAARPADPQVTRVLDAFLARVARELPPPGTVTRRRNALAMQGSGAGVPPHRGD